jgi:hypothetical protein
MNNNASWVINFELKDAKLLIDRLKKAIYLPVSKIDIRGETFLKC